MTRYLVEDMESPLPSRSDGGAGGAPALGKVRQFQQGGITLNKVTQADRGYGLKPGLLDRLEFG